MMKLIFCLLAALKLVSALECNLENPPIGLFSSGGCFADNVNNKADCFGTMHHGIIVHGPVNHDRPNPSGNDIQMISCGIAYCCGVDAVTKHVFCWGEDWYQAVSHAPTNVPMTMVSASFAITCAIRVSDGLPQCWGFESYCSIVGWPCYVGIPTVPMITVTTGYNYACGIALGGGGIECWGDDTFNVIANRPVWTGTGTAIGYEEVACGSTNRCCAIEQGIHGSKPVCWGNAGSIISETPTSGRFKSITGTGSDAFCAINKDTEAVACWGCLANDPYKICGDAPTTGMYGSVTCSYGSNGCCAIEVGTKKAVCWGGFFVSNGYKAEVDAATYLWDPATCPFDPLTAGGYNCRDDSHCQWDPAKENIDWGKFSATNGDCATCETQCTADPNCWAYECNSGYCSWWANGKCTEGQHHWAPTGTKTCRDHLCIGVTCQNGGTCRLGVCTCATGYSGTHCQTNTDDCIGVNCNNGVCVDGLNTYTCSCNTGYSGQHCSVNIDDCAGVTCQNGGSCVDGVNSYTCNCVPGYSGTHCGTNIDECVGVTCHNGGVCVDGVNSYTCSCATGYSGPHCQTNIDDCAGVNCNNGVCVDGINSYTCACNTGFSGTHCETNIDDCVGVTCQNGGTCLDGTNSYTCSCVLGYDGTHCQNNVDECIGVTCHNGGVCIDGINSYTCSCAAGFTGQHCQTNIDDCVGVVCQNGGVCKDAITSYVCDCKDGYAGNHCEFDINECATATCYNGATCLNKVGGHECVCKQPYTGKDCSAKYEIVRDSNEMCAVKVGTDAFVQTITECEELCSNESTCTYFSMMYDVVQNSCRMSTVCDTYEVTTAPVVIGKKTIVQSTVANSEIAIADVSALNPTSRSRIGILCLLVSGVVLAYGLKNKKMGDEYETLMADV